MATQTIRHNSSRQNPAPEAPFDSATTPVTAARQVQSEWARVSLKQRLRIIREARHRIAEQADRFVDAVTYPARNGPAETLASEIIPLADACRFLELEAEGILAPRRFSRRGRPQWLRGISVELRRDPYGVVLIVGASNYPLFLPGVQMLQALAAGNAVLVKPAVNSTGPVAVLRETLVDVGLNPSLLQVLPEELESAHSAIRCGVDKVLLTGSVATGQSVQTLLAQSVTPATMELSGCDAVFVLENADLDLVVRCLAFGLRFNSGASCIAPRRVFVPTSVKDELEHRLHVELLEQGLADSDGDAGRAGGSTGDHIAELVADAIRGGARVVVGGVSPHSPPTMLPGVTVVTNVDSSMPLLRSDCFAPVISLIPVSHMEDALKANDECPYALGATVFGADADARQVARRVNAGCVVINDMIAPTADPRVPFGGRKKSGFGVTRGAAGLEEMTRLKAVIRQRGHWQPHLDEPTPLDAPLLTAFLRMSHSRSWKQRWQGMAAMIQAAMAQRSWKREDQAKRERLSRKR